jgi:hypothetical protein
MSPVGTFQVFMWSWLGHNRDQTKLDLPPKGLQMEDGQHEIQKMPGQLLYPVAEPEILWILGKI